MAEHGVHLAVPAFVAQVGAVQVAGLQGQPVDIRRAQAGALVGRGKQADVTEGQHGQVRLQFADAQFGFRHASLEGRRQAAVLVGGTAVAMHRQQAGVGALGAAVELDAQQAQGIHTKTDGAGRVPRLEVEDETLGPLFGLDCRLAPTMSEKSRLK